LLNQHPALPHSSVCQKVRKAVLTTEPQQRLCPLLDCRHLPENLMKHGSAFQSKGHANGVRQLPPHSERLLTPLPGLVRIAKHLQGIGRIREAGHLKVRGGELGADGIMQLRVIESDALLEVRERSYELPTVVQGEPHREVR